MCHHLPERLAGNAFYTNGHKPMVGPADFPALAKKNPATVRIKGELVEPAGYRVGFNAHRRDSPGMKHIRSRDQHPQRSVRGEENAVVTIQQTIGGRRYVGVKLDVSEVAILVGSVSLMTDGLQREVRPTGFVQYI